MSQPFLKYQLDGGFVHDWLVAGPLAIEVTDLERFDGPNYKLEIAQHYYQAGSGVTQPPVERHPFESQDSGMLWEWVRCQDDHLVERTAFYHTTHYLRSWAYTQVRAQEAHLGTWTLTTNGPADVWINGEHVHRQAHFHHQIPHSVAFTASLQQGKNEILVRFEEVAARECPYAMALHIAGLGESTEIWLPTTMEPIDARQPLGEAITEAYLEREVFKHDDLITVCWPETLKATLIAVRLQTPENRIYAEASMQTSTAKPISLGYAHQFPDIRFNAMVMPLPTSYHEQGIRLRRLLPVTMFPTRAYSTAPYGTYKERRKEALEHAAAQPGNVFAEIAKMELNRWATVDVDLILDTIDGINQRKDCSDFYLVGLLGMIYRYMDKFTFPTKLLKPLQDCVLNFKYWDDEPGSDAMCYRSENHQILFHTCEILAGQLYPDQVFSNAGQTGQWHKEKGEKLALAWLHGRGTTGFDEWDSNCYFEQDLLALSHLADLVESEPVWQMASVVMDKMFLTIALNSYKGVFGSTHGRTYTRHIKGAYLEAASGITRLMWGMGIFNDCLMGMVSMACNEQYELPIPIAAIALDTPEELWNREQHPGVNKVTYKTPDFMLCSAQDYNPGQPGYQQHIWQATLSPEAAVFVTHPPCCSEEGSHRPNFWHGN
ncbi:MAG: hypothetical protein JXA89_06350, partial [Anaerolineae bacterium]|nr:hypothetical protein [Anaerolineae bacterium]